MKNRNEEDYRIKRKIISWKESLLTFLVLSILTSGQALIYSSYIKVENVPIGYVFGIIGYWALVSLSFSLVTRWQVYLKFEKPMRRLGEAARRVASGDFSEFVEPIHTADKTDYIDVMFEDFNKMIEELGSIETLKNDFISNVSHEIKTPLTVIQSYAMAMKREDISSETKREYADTIITASQKLTSLVTNILKLNKLENQEIRPLAEPYDLCRQLATCALSFENLWAKKNIEFLAEIENKCIINADESMLEIVWNNLLSNALKFTEPGGRITLVQTSDAESVTVTISDTGCGMNDETLKHLFDKFYQGDTSHSSEGSGLGLALTLKVIELLDGAITVKSEPGTGTTFTVRLRV